MPEHVRILTLHVVRNAAAEVDYSVSGEEELSEMASGKVQRFQPKAGAVAMCLPRGWCPGAESNHRHEDFQSTALPLSYPGTWVDKLPPCSYSSDLKVSIGCCYKKRTQQLGHGKASRGGVARCGSREPRSIRPFPRG